MEALTPPKTPPTREDRKPLHAVLPPLILGTATFNTQYVADPMSMPYTRIVSRALDLGVNAFDTSPYYGPSEILLGNALAALATPSPSNPAPRDRSSYLLVTKAGRIASAEFDYSPAWIRYSVLRSLQRLHTPYLDLVYTHDVEFVTPAEVLAAVRELRRLRDEDGLVRYVGISGYPPATLAALAEMVLRETGEPLDAVMSYGHFTVQNADLAGPAGAVDDALDLARLQGSPLARLRAAGVGVVLNASMLGMGLLTSRGIPADPALPAGGVADQKSMIAQWHPSPSELRVACQKLGPLAAAAGERLESVAIRWSMQEWARVGAIAGTGVNVRYPGSSESQRLGPSVMGVSSVEELEETVREWQGVLEGDESPRRQKIVGLVRRQLWPALGPEWHNYSWSSPDAGYVNLRKAEERGLPPTDDGVLASYGAAKKKARPVAEQDPLAAAAA